LLRAVAERTAGHPEVFRGPVGVALRLRSPTRRSWDATNYLGGVADVLESKGRRRRLEHLAELANIYLYVNDRQIREVQYTHEVSRSISYQVRVWPLAVSFEAELADTENASHVLTGMLAIDFANTTLASATSPQDGFVDYQTLLQWLLRCGAISADDVRTLSADADRRPAEAQRVLAEALRLRAALIDVLSGPGSGPNEQVALDAIRQTLLGYFAGGKLVWKDGIYLTEWPVPTEVSQSLWPIAASVEDLLLKRGRRQHIRVCAAEGCERLFLDNSRNHKRRWCSMNACGNRAKVRRFRARERAPTAKAAR
jgi:predicted RNA-binding Zn ribbon-like protein